MLLRILGAGRSPIGADGAFWVTKVADVPQHMGLDSQEYCRSSSAWPVAH
jgi:hypothetical protein